MTILHLPFSVEDPDMRAGLDAAKDKVYQETKPDSDTEFAGLVKDLTDEGRARLKFNVGFLIGLYEQQSK